MDENRSSVVDTRSFPKQRKCNHSVVRDPETYETWCTKCGVVLVSPYESSLEETGTSPRIRSSPQYSIPFAHDKSLSTLRGSVNNDASGRRLSLSARQRMRRLKRWDSRSAKQSSDHTRQAMALVELHRLADKLNIPPGTREEAIRVYFEARKENMIRGTPFIVAMPAAIYAACRVRGTPRTLREILKESLVVKEVERMRVARFYRRLLVKLGLQPHNSDPVTYVSKIAEGMRISGKTQGLAIQILRVAKEEHFTEGKDPSGLVAAALYIASLLNNEKRKQKEISKVAGVADATVRHHCKALRKKLNLEHAWRKKNSPQSPEE